MWRSTQMTHAEYLQTLGDAPLPTLAQVPGWEMGRTKGDTMHITNLGIIWHVLGNVLFFLATVKAYLQLGPASDNDNISPLIPMLDVSPLGAMGKGPVRQMLAPREVQRASQKYVCKICWYISMTQKHC